MRYSRITLAMLLMFVLIFGSSMMAFAKDEPKLNLSAEPVGAGSVIGHIYQDHNEWCATITATGGIKDDIHYVFDKWQEYTKHQGKDKWIDFSNNWKENIKFKNPNDERTFRAVFKPAYQLNITVQNPEMGSTAGTPEGLYKENTSIDILSTPNPGYRVLGWWKDGEFETDMDNLSFKMPAMNVSVLLKYEALPSFEVTGEVSPENSGEIENLGSYKVGEEVILHGTPERGFVFSEWEYDKDVISPDINYYVFKFKMPEEDVHVKAFFTEIDPIKVGLYADPEEGGNPFFNGPDYDGWYYPGEEFTVDPNPNDHFQFLKWSWTYSCPPPVFDEDDEISTRAIAYDESTDIDHVFEVMGCQFDITAHYIEDFYVHATLQYHDTQGNKLKPDKEDVKVYIGPYSLTHDAIPGWQHIYSTPNASGTITEESGDFIVTFVYQVPPTPTVITETVVVTETVTVTVPAPTETVTEEEVPLAPVSAPLDLDSIYDQTPPPPTAPAEDIDLEEVPLADALPQTGQIPAEGFYGIGGLISAIGIYLKKRSLK